jgi:undecaprenyl diphosphate synthase
VVKTGALNPENIDEEVISSYLYTSNIPDPDLLIRTGGEQRISNYLLWQIAYTEIYVTEVFWPEFGEEELSKAVLEFAARERRYGLRLL